MIRKFISSACILALIITSAQLCLVFANEQIIDWYSIDSAKEEIFSAQDLSDQHFEAGQNYLKKGSDDTAIKEFSKAIELDPQNADAYDLRASAYVRTGYNKRALSDYNNLIKLCPNDACAYSARGFVYYDLGQDNEASADFKKASELNPEFTIAMKTGPVAIKQIYNTPSPKSAFKKTKPSALAKLPDEKTILNNFNSQIPIILAPEVLPDAPPEAKIPYAQKGVTIIADPSDKAQATSKNSSNPASKVAFFIHKNGVNIIKKLSGFFTVKSHTSTNAPISTTLNKAVLGQAPQEPALKQVLAKPTLQKLDLEVTYIQKRVERGINFSNAGKFEKAQNEFSRGIRRNPSDPELYLLCADAYLGVGDRENAIANIEKALQIKPDYKAALTKHFELALTIEKEFRQKTLTDALNFIKIEPTNSKYYKVVANIYFHENKYFAAATYAILFLKVETSNKINNLLKPS